MKRLNPFAGMVVSLADASYSAYESADAIRQRTINEFYHPGVVSGLTVFSSGSEYGTVAFTPGAAYDMHGERIGVNSLQDKIHYGAKKLNEAIAHYYLYAEYQEGNDGTYGITADGSSAFRHLTDSFSFDVAKVGVDTVPADAILLSGIQTTIVGGSLIIDSGIRNLLTSKFGGSGGGGDVSFDSDGDIVIPSVGKGIILTSPDGTKMCRILLDDQGYLAQEPLNYLLA